MNQSRMNHKSMKYVESNKNKNKNKTIKKGRSRLGGEALASGGFGCSFKPALKCKGKNDRIDGVSKMSIEKHGKQEMNEIERIKTKLIKIKNYQRYYLLDVNMCKPDKLTPEDMKQLDEMLTKISDFYEEEVDTAVDALTALIEPIMMVFLGGTVGTMLIAMYLPIFKIAGAIE